jgi:twitching motility protein PilT
MDELAFQKLLQLGLQNKASDILIKVGQPPAFRIGRQLHYLKTDKLSPEHTRSVARIVLSKTRFKGELDDIDQYDTSYAGDGIGRYRVNIYRQRGSFALAMRSIPLVVPSFDSLNVPQGIRGLAEVERGMILVCGAAGNGKSSTLASIVSHINHTKRVHIITIEDPIEFIHEDKQAAMSQREVGLDVPNFAAGLRGALRQDPDVILVGEIRDSETMQIALQAAETGHLVLSTLHTPDVTRTVGRVTSLLTDHDSSDIRERFADNIRGIVAQRLVPKADGHGLALACEILIGTGTARDSLKRPENNVPLKDIMERGVHPYGMQTFEMHLQALVKAGVVSVETAKQVLS